MPKVAAIQMCSSDVVEDNLKAAGKLIQQAASYDAKLIVLPEMFAIMGKQQGDAVKVKENAGHGKIQDFLAEQALKSGCWIVSGTIPLASDNPAKIRAASLVYNHKGEVVARYDKMHLFDVKLSEQESYHESDSTSAGNDVVVIDTPVGKLGLIVCYDIRFSALFIELIKKGAEIIAVPAAFTQKTGKAHWHLLSRARAVETFCYVVGACQSGIHASGRGTYGHSLIINPWGEILDELNRAGEGIAYADIDLAALYRIRLEIPSVRQQQ